MYFQPPTPSIVQMLTTSNLITAISAVLISIAAARGEGALTIAASESSTLTENCTKYNN